MWPCGPNVLVLEHESCLRCVRPPRLDYDGERAAGQPHPCTVKPMNWTGRGRGDRHADGRGSLYRRHRFRPEVISDALGVFRFSLAAHGRAGGACPSCPMKPSASGDGNSARRSPIGSASALPLAATNGTWTKPLSRSWANDGSWRAVDQGLCSRRPDPAPKRLARGAAAHEEALEIRRHAAARHDHGQLHSYGATMSAAARYVSTS